MRVFIVTTHECEGDEILEVFTDFSKAVEFVYADARANDNPIINEDRKMEPAVFECKKYFDFHIYAKDVKK